MPAVVPPAITREVDETRISCNTLQRRHHISVGGDAIARHYPFKVVVHSGPRRHAYCKRSDNDLCSVSRR